jgi:exodeoxyribonuclease VII small subunit
MEKKKSFEDQLTGVQEMIGRIESGQLPLEESVREYETGMKTLKALEKELAEINRRITVLQEGENEEKPLEGAEH